MSINVKNMLREVMTLSWQLIRKNGFSKREALKVAWANIKLRMQMKTRIVKFWYTKINGDTREAFGTLAESIVPETVGSGRRPNETVQTYWDAEKGDWRCYKKANLLRIVTL